MNPRTLVIGDIHGGYRALLQVLERAEVSSQDRLIFLGDYVDGWSESAQVIAFLMELSKKQSCIFIKGNHDAWCEDWLNTGHINPRWWNHGGKETFESYEGLSQEERTAHLRFFNAMLMYHRDTENRMFLHAGFSSMHGVEKEMQQEVLFYDRTLWEMALSLDGRLAKDSAFYPNRLKHYREIYIGHTPTINFKRPEPMQAANVWNVDTGAAFTGKLSLMDIETKSFWQSDPLPELYPNEKGRNPS